MTSGIEGLSIEGSNEGPGLDEPGLAPAPAPVEAPPRRTALLEREVATPLPDLEDGDHERFAHYVQKEKILESALSGDPVIALCGKVWVPGRDPGRFPVCPTCKEIFEGLSPGGGDGDKGDQP